MGHLGYDIHMYRYIEEKLGFVVLSEMQYIIMILIWFRPFFLFVGGRSVWTEL